SPAALERSEQRALPRDFQLRRRIAVAPPFTRDCDRLRRGPRRIARDFAIAAEEEMPSLAADEHPRLLALERSFQCSDCGAAAVAESWIRLDSGLDLAAAGKLDLPRKACARPELQAARATIPETGDGRLDDRALDAAGADGSDES